MEFGDLEFVAFRTNRALCAENAHVARARQVAHGFDGGANHPQHAAIGCHVRQILLLDGAQGLGRGRVAGQDDEFAAAGEEFRHGLQGVAIHYVEGARTVGCAGVVAEVKIIVVGQASANLSQDRQAAVARIKNTDHVWSGIETKK